MIDFSKTMKGEPTDLVENPYDMELVKKKFLVYSSGIDKMVAEAEAQEVTDHASLEKATAMATTARNLYKKVEDQRKQMVAPANDFAGAVNKFSKLFLDRLKETFLTEGTGLKKKITDHQYRMELERREKERKAQEAAKELQRQLDDEAKKKGVESVTVTPQVEPKTSKVTRTESGSAHMRMIWMFEIEDETQIPREYLAVNEGQIRRAIGMGVRKIEGIRIFQKPSTSFR